MSQTQDTSEVKQIGKLSVRGIGCAPVGAEEPTRLCVIYGKADGIKVGEDKNTGRLWNALTGSFEATNLQNGQRYRSGKLFLPGGIHEVVENAVKSLTAAQVDDGMTVTFGIEIRSVKATNPIGYSYQAVNMLPTQASDELDNLRQAISDARAAKGLPPLPAAPISAPALPAPAPAAQAPAPAPAAQAPAPAPAARTGRSRVQRA